MSRNKADSRTPPMVIRGSCECGARKFTQNRPTHITPATEPLRTSNTPSRQTGPASQSQLPQSFSFKPGFPYVDPAPEQRGLERDDMIPVACVYPASVNGAS